MDRKLFSRMKEPALSIDLATVFSISDDSGNQDRAA
jgi:hypothetical protein